MNSIEEAVVKVVCNESPVSPLAFRGLSVLQTGQTLLSNPPTKLTTPCDPPIASES